LAELETKRRNPGVLFAYAFARLRGLDARAYVWSAVVISDCGVD
jgi:hypothetical protein